VKYFIEEYVAPKDVPEIVRPEINLAKWPQLFATRQTRGRSRVIQRGDSQVIIGRQIDNKGAEVEVGFLIVPDYVVLLGLVQLWELHDRPQDGYVTGRVREFLEKVLSRKPSGKGFIDLERSLKRLVHVPLNWVNAFFDSRTNKLESITDHTFRFLQELKITKVRRGEKLQISTFSFKFNDHFLQNLLSGWTKPLNLSEILKFNREISVLAYSFLDLVMAERAEWSRRATSFMRDDLQIAAARYAKPAQCRNELNHVLRELAGCRLSTGMITRAQLRRTSDGRDYKLIIHKAPLATEAPLPLQPAHQSGKDEAEEQALVTDMLSVLGRAHNQRFYQIIAQRCPREVIHIALQDTLMEARSGKIQTSKAAFFGYWIQELCRQRGITLPIKSSFKDPRKS
jgi:hypothetical protein